MEKKLDQLFEYQRFEGNKTLEAMLFAVENRYPVQLSDEDLDFVNAAGDLPRMKQEKREKRLEK